MTKNEPSALTVADALSLRSKLAVKIRAGRMILQDGVVRPVLKKGFMCLLRDSLMNDVELAWFSEDGEEQYRFLLPPGKVKVSWVEKCTSGRVILFDVDNGKNLYFFWMQSRSTDLDEAVMRRVQSTLEKNSQQFAINKSQQIQMSTFQKIIEEVWQENVNYDIDIAELLSSSKLHEALCKDPTFYAARMQRFLAPEQLKDVNKLDPVKIVQDSQVQWTGIILNNLLRSGETHSQISILFLGRARRWSAYVGSFLLKVLQIFSNPENTQNVKSNER